MKLANDTLTILQNFASINQNIEFKQGKKLRTMSSGKTVLASATIPDEFPQTFCVHDLNQFLVVYSLNKDTELTFDDKNIIFKAGKSKTKYRMTEKSTIVVPPEKELQLPSKDVSFTLTETDLAALLKATSVLKSPHVSIESDGDKIFAKAFDAKDNSAHTNSIEVAEGNGKTFSFVFLPENFKMIPGSYDVEISAKGLASFSNTKIEIDYFIAMEAKFSEFDGKKVA
jgi:hypothetical protein